MSDGYKATGAQSASSPVIELPEDCTIRGAPALASGLSQSIHGPSPVFDSRPVKAFDVAGLQMLLSAQKTAQGSGKTIEILTDGDGALSRAAERAGLMAEFKDLLVPPPT